MGLFEENSKNHTSKRDAKNGKKVQPDALKCTDAYRGGYNRRVRDARGSIGEHSYVARNVPPVTCIQVRPIVGYIGHTALVWSYKYVLVGRENVKVWTGIDRFACYVVSVPVYLFGPIDEQVDENGHRFTRDGDGKGTYLLHGTCTFSGRDRTDVQREREKSRDYARWQTTQAYLSTFRPDLEEERAALKMRQKERKRILRVAAAKKRQADAAIARAKVDRCINNCANNKQKRQNATLIASLNITREREELQAIADARNQKELLKVQRGIRLIRAEMSEFSR